MRVVVINTAPGAYSARDIENSLGAIAAIVGDDVVPSTLAQLLNEGLELMTGRKGLLSGSEPNANLYPFFYVGTVVVVGDKPEGITDGQLAFLYKWLAGLTE